ncbi:metal-binding protein [Magnetospirillum sp. XM-1]|uniref:metal-binding protein n=1 Tax=Magnetospirillum sp. XM-1 TaxID=1663591 RepID=UPI000AF87E46|nr:metal-binding protein [Magnetospirillum sp. XM-1]
MSEAETCDLCGLPAPPGSAHLKAGDRDLVFCCESCRGIWVMLNPDAIKDKGDKK